MTKNSKEQIIIDDVDVSKCFIYSSHHTRTMCCSGLYCKQNEFANCHFKLYARKTQECESLKKDYAELERECERLKSYGATLLADKNAMEIGRDDYMQRCKRLEQECEELKEKNKVLQKLVSELEYSVQTGIELNARCCNALEEIEKIVNKKTETSICGKCVYNHIAECQDNCMQDVLENILDIINKAKGERDE